MDDPDATIVLLLLLLRIRWLGRGIRFTHLLCMLPEGAGGPIQPGGEVEGGDVGAGDGVGSGGPCGVWVALGARRSRADLRPSRDLMLELACFLPSLDVIGGGMRGLSLLYALLSTGGPW